MQLILNQLAAKFEQIFAQAASDCRYFFAPGRVNLIGEHTDYNGGNVFPCALDRGTYALVKSRSDKQFRLYSENFPAAGLIEFNLAELSVSQPQQWVNYPKGVLKTLLDSGMKINHGLEILVSGNIPNGAGLSSSASIEVLMGVILNNIFNLKLSPIEIALNGQKAENNYIGVACGIMDQFASAMGRENQAILLDCKTLNYRYAPLQLGDYCLIIANTKKQRGLADSKYNQRRQECEEALALLATRLKINSLGEINEQQLTQNSDLFSSKPVLLQRAEHAVSENQRTLRAYDALVNHDLILFGELMKQSHISLRDKYAVSGFELDSLVTAAWAHPGCIGSRMTGAGFGGCSVNLVAKDQLADFIATVTASYNAKTKLEAEFYTVNPAAGAGEIINEPH